MDRSKYQFYFKVESGAEIALRSLHNQYLLIDLFEEMSPHSIYLLFLRNLNAPPESIINLLLNIDDHSSFFPSSLASKNKKIQFPS